MPPQNSSTVNPYFSAGVGIAGDIVGMAYNAYQANQQRKWTEKMVKEQREWDLNMWNMTNEYNTPANQVSRLESAGLNPLYYGLDGSSAGTMSAASPLGYERAGAPRLSNPVDVYQDAVLKNAQAQNIEADTRNKDQNTRKQAEEAAGTALDNYFKQATMDARIEGEKLSKVDLPKSKMREIDKNIEKMSVECGLLAKQTDSEIVKQGLMQIEGRLKNAEIQKIFALLPYQQLLLDAQTESQRMAASQAFTHSLYEAGLIDAGYIDALVKECTARAESEEEKKALQEWEKNVKSGNYFNGSTTWFGKLGDKVANSILEFCSTAGAALGPLSGIVTGVVGGKAIGKGMRANSATNQPYQSSKVGSYTGSDFGNPVFLD